MRQFLVERLIVSLIFAGILLGYVIMSSHTITFAEPKKQYTDTPWPTCLTVPTRIRCDPFEDPFATTTTWHHALQPDK